jgi:biotin carboxylase
MGVLLVFPATSYRIDAFVECAAELGLALVLASDLPAPRYGLREVRVDFADVDASLAAVDAVEFDGVVAVDERSAVVAAAAAERRGCKHHTLAGVLAARDKRRMREVQSTADVPMPRHQVLKRDASPGEVSFPCVVKPPMLSGSQGVIRANDRDELLRAIARTRRVLEHHASDLRKHDGFYELLIEEYVAGPEVAVDGIMRDGKLELVAIFDKPDALDGPFFEETIYVTPADDRQGSLQRVSERAAQVLGLNDGPIHAELRIAKRGPVLIEIAARSIGGLCGRVLQHVALPDGAASLEELLLRRASGHPRSPSSTGLQKQNRASGVMMVPVPRSGVLRRVDGVDEARAIEGIDAVSINIEPGQSVRALPEGVSYLGFIFAHGESPAAVTQLLRDAHAALRFSLTPLLTTW